MTDQSPYFWTGSLSMGAALALKALPSEPQRAKEILRSTLAEYLPNATPELAAMLRKEGVK